MPSGKATRDVMRELAALENPNCLAEIGIRHAGHRARAIAIGKQLAVLIDYPASPGCTPPYAPVWIAEMVRRNEDTQRARRRGTG